VLTEVDDGQAAFYFFDDAFASEHGLAAYLLLDDWRLPDGAGSGGWRDALEATLGPGGAGPGRLYVAELELEHEHLADLHNQEVLWQIEGVRMPEVCRWLMGLADATEEDFGRSMAALRKALLSGDLPETDEERAFLLALREDPDDELTWCAYNDWLAERGGRAANYRLLERALPRLLASYPLKTLDQVGDHVVQSFQAPGDDRHDHWYFFDDLWASEHPDLAEALLRHATRWDVLSTGNEVRHD
jgi:uncharacterized protein (TIGR02996 family)